MPAAAIGRRVGRGLVDDQVADHARLGVEDVCPVSSARRTVRPGRPTGKAGVIGSGGRGSGVVRRGKGWSAAPNVSRPGEQVVARAVDRAQAVGRERRSGIWSGPGPTSVAARVGRRRRRSSDVALGDLDLLEDERQVAGRDGEAVTHRSGRRPGQGRCGRLQSPWATSRRPRMRARRRVSASWAGPAGREDDGAGTDGCRQGHIDTSVLPCRGGYRPQGGAPVARWVRDHLPPKVLEYPSEILLKLVLPEI